ncbi:MAG: lysylphosphatidylglycerol synthase transmembrane domain-containing protein [Pyrinomonadaceae bacterium]
MRKYLKFILLLLFAVFLLWFFGRNLDWKQVSQSLQQARAFYIILAVLGISFGYLLRAIRWRVLLAPITETSMKELFATTTVGFAAVFLVGRMGEIVRPMWLPMRDKRVRPSAALVTLGLERIFDLAALVTFFAINLLWLKAPPGREAEFENIQVAGILMLAGVVVGFLALIIYQKYSAPLIPWFKTKLDKKFIPGKVKSIFLSLLQQLAKSLEILTDWREIANVSFWTLTLWLTIALPTWFVLLAFDLPLDFSHSLFILGFAAISSVVPTPGGAAGAFHAVTAGGLIFLMGDEPGVWEKAAAVSIVMHLVYFAPAVFFGLYYFLHGDISLERFKSLLSSEHAVEEVEEEVVRER